MVLGCSKFAAETKLSIPVLHDCFETIERAKQYYLKKSVGKPYSLNIEIEEFDDVHYLYNGPIGMATLISKGEWESIGNISAADYLKATANGIFADCAPISMTSISLIDNPDITVKELASMAEKYGVNIVEVTKEKIVINYNDGSYKYQF